MLDEVSLAVGRGRLAFVGGANGAGKTTLLRVLTGLLAADAGTVRIEGIDGARDRRAYQRRVAYVTAGGTGLYARLGVEQHLRIWARMAFVPGDEVPRRVAGTLAAFGLTELRRRRVDRLSMGQRQRLRLALAFLPSSAVLLLDEPETSLDEPGMLVLRRAVQARLAMGACAVWCAPDADGLAPTDAYVLRDGKLVAA